MNSEIVDDCEHDWMDFGSELEPKTLRDCIRSRLPVHVHRIFLDFSETEMEPK